LETAGAAANPTLFCVLPESRSSSTRGPGHFLTYRPLTPNYAYYSVAQDASLVSTKANEIAEKAK